MIDGVFNNTLTTATGLFLSSFSFVTGLAWNDAITASIDEYVNLKKDKVISKVFYALIITGIMVIIGYLIESWKEGSIITVIPMKLSVNMNNFPSGVKIEEIPPDLL